MDYSLLTEALIFGICVLGIIISFRIVGFPDLTIEGSFTLGAAMFAFGSRMGFPVWGSILLAISAGSLAGLFTSTIVAILKINKLLAGIITVTILYSINLLIMKGPNVGMLYVDTLFSVLPINSFLLVLIIYGILFIIFLYFFKTNIGLLFRATGNNQEIIIRSGYKPNIFVSIGLIISNGLIALSGCLLAQKQGFSDISMGSGMLIIALTSLMLGEYLTRPVNIFRLLLASFVGAYIFILIKYFALDRGLEPVYLNLVTGLLFLLVLSFEKFHLGLLLLNSLGKNKIFSKWTAYYSVHKRLNIGSDFI